MGRQYTRVQPSAAAAVAHGWRPQATYRCIVASVRVLGAVLKDVTPDARRRSCKRRVHTLALAIEEEVAEAAGEEVVRQEQEQARVELEGARELRHQLPHAVQELKGGGGSGVEGRGGDDW